MGGMLGFTVLQVTEPDTVGTVIKAIAALIIGLLGTMLSNWLSKKFPAK